MPSFALIAEGLTDQIILERMIVQVCDNMFENGVDVNPVRPKRDTTDSIRAPHAGWELVLDHCKDDATDALATNDYVVIHLDTDKGDHPNFGLPLTKHGIDRPYSDLISDATTIIKAKLGLSLYNENAARFIFAISVHTMESWLLLCILVVMNRRIA